MKRTWTIIGVGDVAGSLKWYQSLLALPQSAPAHEYFGQVVDSDGTVLLCLHEWGAHEHPSLTSPHHAPPAKASSCSFAWMTSTGRYCKHALSLLGWRRSRT